MRVTLVAPSCPFLSFILKISGTTRPRSSGRPSLCSASCSPSPATVGQRGQGPRTCQYSACASRHCCVPLVWGNSRALNLSKIHPQMYVWISSVGQLLERSRHGTVSGAPRPKPRPKPCCTPGLRFANPQAYSGCCPMRARAPASPEEATPGLVTAWRACAAKRGMSGFFAPVCASLYPPPALKTTPVLPCLWCRRALQAAPRRRRPWQDHNVHRELHVRAADDHARACCVSLAVYCWPRRHCGAVAGACTVSLTPLLLWSDADTSA